MCSIHAIFHPSQLEPSAPNTIPNHVQALPPLVKIDGKLKYEIVEILDSKINCCCQHCQLLYLVCWSGYEGTDDKTSWLLVTELGNTSEPVMYFHQKYPDKPGPHADSSVKSVTLLIP